eukprot:TRINITY_DN124704_c0_g1_i1.p1 TRINITY_DN124704_c0_g1~~TRINITY_DN124704_c0_g1_i1.p1  ORF type:complete len:289 (-),score=31.26 TRINITY_DN124704_c0_g1_i1:302-1126(-)
MARCRVALLACCVQQCAASWVDPGDYGLSTRTDCPLLSLDLKSDSDLDDLKNTLGAAFVKAYAFMPSIKGSYYYSFSPASCQMLIRDAQGKMWSVFELLNECVGRSDGYAGYSCPGSMYPMALVGLPVTPPGSQVRGYYGLCKTASKGLTFSSKEEASKTLTKKFDAAIADAERVLFFGQCQERVIDKTGKEWDPTSVDFLKAFPPPDGLIGTGIYSMPDDFWPVSIKFDDACSLVIAHEARDYNKVENCTEKLGSSGFMHSRRLYDDVAETIV